MEQISIDAIDLRLLAALQQDASRTNVQLAADTLLSPPTCLRRVQRLRQSGLIVSEVALLDGARLGTTLSAVVEVSLDRQDAQSLAEFEALAVADAAVQQCYRTSPGPDFVLIVVVVDMPAYQALALRLFTGPANVRNVKAFFCLHRAKFGTQIPLAAVAGSRQLP